MKMKFSNFASVKSYRPQNDPRLKEKPDGTSLAALARERRRVLMGGRYGHTIARTILERRRGEEVTGGKIPFAILW